MGISYRQIVPLTLLLACGGSADAGIDDEARAGNAPSSNANGNATFGGGGAGATTPVASTPGSDGCSDNARLVYVISSASELYAFDPATLATTKKATVACPGERGNTLNAMAVDREGNAWISYRDHAVYKVNVSGGDCVATGLTIPQVGAGVSKMGMAFVKNGDGSESLYVSGLGLDGVATATSPGGIVEPFASSGGALIRANDAKTGFARVGAYRGELATSVVSLSGTGDGQLWSLLFSNASTLIKIDAQTGAVSPGINVQLPPDAQYTFGDAFAFWGGDMYVFQSGLTHPSRVARVNPVTGEAKIVVADAGPFLAIGAGVSTCAPTTRIR